MEVVEQELWGKATVEGWQRSGLPLYSAGEIWRQGHIKKGRPWVFTGRLMHCWGICGHETCHSPGYVETGFYRYERADDGTLLKVNTMEEDLGFGVDT